MNLRKPRKSRLGTTSVEFAMVCPVVFAMIFASFEFSRACMLRNTCAIAAAEGARRGILPGATAQECEAAALAELALIGATGGTVVVLPPTIEDHTDEVEVRVTVPVGQNGYVIPQFFVGKSITKSVTLKRETPVTR